MNIINVIRQNRWFLFFLIIVSFALRAILFDRYLKHDQHCWLSVDSYEYSDIAKQIAQGNGITTKDGAPNFFRMPGYPIFLGACYKFFKYDTEKALWVQIAFTSIVPILVFILSLTLFPSSLATARCASLATALHPGFILYAGMVASESVFMPFFLMFFILLFSCLRFAWCREEQYRKSFVWIMFTAGIFLGIASLIRAVGHYVLLLTLVLLLFSALSLANKLKAMGALTIGWLGIVGFWLVRNYMLAGALFFHTLPGIHFLRYSAVYVVREQEGCSYFDAKNKLFSEWDSRAACKEQALGRPLNEYERFNVAEDLAKDYILSKPLVSIKHAIIQMARTFFAVYSVLFLNPYEGEPSLWGKIKAYVLPKTTNNYLIPFIYFELLFLLLMITGFFVFIGLALFSKEYRCVLAKVGPYIALLLFITLAAGAARMRYPIDPFIILFSSCAWVTLIQRMRQHATTHTNQ